MLDLRVERRANLLFFVILVLLLALMTAQVRSAGERRSMLESALLVVVSPIARGLHGITIRAVDAWSGYVDLRGVVEDNDRLKRRLRRLELAAQRYYAETGRMERIGKLLGYRPPAGFSALYGNAVYLDTASGFKTLIVDAGGDLGVRVNAPVVSSSGLVGRVVVSTPAVSKAQLLIDSSFSCGALIARNRQQGVVHGDGKGGATLGYIPNLADVREGDDVFTSGLDGIFPGGIFVGKVREIERSPEELFMKVRLEIGTRFDHLEEVLILRNPAMLEAAPAVKP